ncbi:Nucleolar protein 8 [Quillaja saponaria]|nr:Nucleolar protein 8 [Quillaja saponaria]
MGVVDEMDIIRTKGRSFAYVDFTSDPKSLSKLFSTYNGCLWKGGKLRLEKAKEHYLVRMKREWAEDAELSSRNPCVDDDKHMSAAEPSKSISSEEKQIHIFFPRLRKLKALPLSGTGKHKYSFQHVQVSGLPRHFCDCEEHSGPLDSGSRKLASDVKADSGGMNDEEINIMNSVMNKLFEREMVSGTVSGENKEVSIRPFDETEEASATDEDDLVINMTQKNRISLKTSQKYEKILGKKDIQDSRFNATGTSDGEPTKNTLKMQNKKIHRKSLLNLENNKTIMPSIPEGERNMQTHPEELGNSGAQPAKLGPAINQSTTKVSWSQKSSWRELVGDRENSTFNASYLIQGSASMKEEQQRANDPATPKSTVNGKQKTKKHGNLGGKLIKTDEVKGVVEAQPTNISVASNQSGRGASWLQDRSWIQLVSDHDNSFSISQILPGSAFQKPVELEPNNVEYVDLSSNDSKHCNVVNQDGSESTRDGSILGRGNHGVLPRGSPNGMQQAVSGNCIGSGPMIEKRCDTVPNKTSALSVKTGETCAFMRSSASLKEWAKTKAALSRSLKRKRSEK